MPLFMLARLSAACLYLSLLPVNGQVTDSTAEPYIDVGSGSCTELPVLPVDQDSPREPRQTDQPDLWENGIVYYRFDPFLTARERKIWQDAMHWWQSGTCVRFRLGSSHTPQLVTLTDRYGCSSYVGAGTYPSSIGADCMNTGTAAHELGHVLGLYHTQSRSDRDEHVVIHFDNIQPQKRSNFWRRSSIPGESFPYDFDSIMHYGPYGFSINDLPSITVLPEWLARRKPSVTGLIGQRRYLSHIDKLTINYLYNCYATGSGQQPGFSARGDWLQSLLDPDQLTWYLTDEARQAAEAALPTEPRYRYSCLYACHCHSVSRTSA